MSVFALFTAAGIDWPNKFKANQQQSSIGATASAVRAPLQIHLTGLHRQSAGSEGAVCKLRESVWRLRRGRGSSHAKGDQRGGKVCWCPLRFKQPVIDGFKIQQQRRPNIGGNVGGRWGGRTRSSKISWRTAAPEWQWRSEGGGGMVFDKSL